MFYRYLLIIYIFIFIKICKIYSRNITITGIIHSFYDEDYSFHRIISNAFNEYSREKGLGIKLDLTAITPETATNERESYGTTIDSLLSRRSEKYDIYFYFSGYGQAYGNHFINLNDYLEEEYIKEFDEKILKEGCSSSDKKLIALPALIDISALFSNQKLLSKYGKDVPKTWDELMSTSKYIYEEEKKKDNTIIRYHSSMNDMNGGTAIYEFINSFRESNFSPHPKIKSKETFEALQYLKEMKNELGEAIFKNPEDKAIVPLLFGGEIDYLFIRYFYVPHDPSFKATALPGRREGVSGSYVKSTNLSISKYISDERIEAALEFLKFIALKETQVTYNIKNSFYSAMTELYDEEDICNIIECNVIKDAYPFSMKDNDVNLFGSDSYNKKYSNYFFDFLYKDQPLNEVIKKIDDIIKIYKFLLTTEDSNAGLIIFIVFLVLATCIVLSLPFVFIKKFERKFKFLSKDLWIITTLGSLILMCSLLTLYGDVNNTKCHLKIVLINVGFVLSVCPSLHRLITNFPEKNKISSWFEKNKYISILIIMIFTATLNGIFVISSYSIQDLKTSNGLNFNKCYMKNMFGNIMYYFIQIYDIFMILISLFLIFLEWSLQETSLDVRYLATAFFMDILSIILLIIIDKIQLDYIIYNVLLAVIIMFFSLSNHLFVYFIRIISISGNDNDSRKILGKVDNSSSKKVSFSATNNSSRIAETITTNSSTTASNKSSSINGITKKIMDYHNQRSIV